MPTVVDLGQAKKQQRPGAYDDIDDAELGRAVKAANPGAYDDFAEAAGPAPQPGLTPRQSRVPPPPNVMTTAEQGKDILSRIGNAVADYSYRPLKHMWDVGGIPALEEIATGARSNLDKFASSPKPSAGDYARAVPLIGPPAADIAHRFRSGDVAGGLAAVGTMGLGAAFPELLKSIPDRLTAPPLVRNVNNPVEQSALNYAASKNIPMTVGQRTGQQGLQRVEQSLENFPGSSSRTREFYNTQREALSKEAGRLATSASPVNANPYEAGLGVQQKLQQNINALKGRADTTYEQVRNEAAQNQKTLQTGSEIMMVPHQITGQPTPWLDMRGNPVQVPITQTFNSPIDLQPIQQQLAPIYEDIKATLPVGKQQYSKAFTVLSDIMNRRTTTQPLTLQDIQNGITSTPPIQRYMDAMDFDKALGAIKSITRDGTSDLLSGRSQGLAKQIIKAGEDQLDQALPAGTRARLSAGRDLVRRYYDVDQTLQDLHDEPGALYHNLVTGGDRTVNTLKFLQQQAPQQLQTVGRTFLNGLVEKATREGGWGRADGVAADWNRLGPETKNLMFGPQLTGDMNNFVLAAKRLTSSKNPSGSALSIGALYGYGTIGAAAAALLHGAPLEAAEAVGTGAALPNLGARMLFTPGGAKLLTQAISVPVSSPAFRTAMGRLQAIYGGTQMLPRPPQNSQ